MRSLQQKVPLSLLTVGALRMETGSLARPGPGSGACVTGHHVPLRVSAKWSHLPLKVFVELFAESVDAGPVQLLVQGICGSVCRSRGSQYGLVAFLPLLTLPCVWQGQEGLNTWERLPSTSGRTAPGLSPDLPAQSMGRSTHGCCLPCLSTRGPHLQDSQGPPSMVVPTMLTLPSLSLFSRTASPFSWNLYSGDLGVRERSGSWSLKNYRLGSGPRKARLSRKGEWPRNHRNLEQQTWVSLGPGQLPRGGNIPAKSGRS